MKIVKLISVLSIASFAAIANAGVVNFVDLAATEGEAGSAVYDTTDIGAGTNPVQKAMFAFYGITITAGSDNPYLDGATGSGVAGMGVCTTLSATDQCTPSSDDNISTGEVLTVTFVKAVTVNNIWVNNNHDGNFEAGDMIDLNGTAYSISAGLITGSTLTAANMVDPLYSLFAHSGASPFAIAAGSSFTIGYVPGTTSDPQFYLSAFEVNINNCDPRVDDFCTTVVPVPASIPLMAIGLMGLGAFRLKKRA